MSPLAADRKNFGPENRETTQKVVFMFPGLGSHFAGMAKGLYQTSATFQASLDEMENIVTSLGLPSFIGWVIGATPLPLDDVLLQIGTVAVEAAVALEWQRHGLVPDLVLGHSLGSYAGLFVSGVLSLRDMLFFVGRQAQSIQSRCDAYAETMLSVRGTPEIINQLGGEDSWKYFEICCYNSKDSLVVGGPTDRIRRLQAGLIAKNIRTAELPMQYAYHTRQIEPVMEEIRKIANCLTFNPPRVPLASTVLGKIVADTETITSEYVASVIRVPVQFAEALQAIWRDGKTEQEIVWLELGPGSACCSFVMGMLEVDQNHILQTIDSLQDSQTTFLQCATRLSNMGIELDIDMAMFQDNEVPQGSDQISTGKATPIDPFKVFLELLSRQTRIKVEDLLKVKDKTFEDLGLDSMQAVAILRAVKDQTAIELPASCFREFPTLETMKERLKKSFLSPVQSTRPSVPTERSPTSEYRPSVTSFLLQGDSESKQPALFLLTDGEGSATSYVSLPQLSSCLPVYGLPSPFVEDPSDDHTIEEIAPMYIEEILRVRPHGPYLLGGWSLGGTVAYEVARLLSSKGKKISGLILIDSPSPATMFGAQEVNLELVTMSNKVRGLELSVKKMQNVVMSHNMVCRYRGTPWDHQSVPFKTFLILARCTNFQMQSINIAAAKEIIACMKKGEPMPQRFKDNGIPGAGWGTAEKDSFGPNGWEELLGSTVQTVVVDGSHYSMMNQPLVIPILFYFAHLLTLHRSEVLEQSSIRQCS
jgi:thioesterase domain-containing protein/malonyl CoA-acyl carrier protein transacylase/acyl carrier protein